MDAHFKQIMDILKEEKCQGQLVANPNEYSMEDEFTYYHEQTTTTPRNEETVEENFCEPSLEDPLGECFDQFCEQVVVENQMDERKEEQTEDLEEPHQEKEESTKTFSTLALIPETPKGQERSLLELPNEQIEDIKIEKLHESSSYFISVHDEKSFEKTQSGPPYIQTIGIPLQWEDIILFGAREGKTGASSLKCHSLAKDVKLNAHGRHPTTYPFYFLFLFSFIFILFLFFTVNLVFCFSRTSVLEFKFGGNALSHTCSSQFLHLPGKIFP
jgi:hypothetical protein